MSEHHHTRNVLERLNVLHRKLDSEGLHIRAKTVLMAIDEIESRAFVTDAMVTRALDASDFCRNELTAKWMRAALEAALTPDNERNVTQHEL